MKGDKKVYCTSFHGVPYICPAQALPGSSSSSDVKDSIAAEPAETPSIDPTQGEPAGTLGEAEEIPPPPEPIQTIQSKKLLMKMKNV